VHPIAGKSAKSICELGEGVTSLMDAGACWSMVAATHIESLILIIIQGPAEESSHTFDVLERTKQCEIRVFDADE
jgi:hypothetical protein